MIRKFLIRRVKRDESGATLMEFALIAGPFMLLMLGIMDIGYQGYLDTVSKSQMHKIARQSAVGGMTKAAIKTEVVNALDPLLLKGSVVEVDVSSFFDFTNIGKPEKITYDDDGDGVIDSGDCFLDGNGNGTFDTNFGVAGTGGPDDIVYYEVTITSPRLFPIASLIGGKTTIRNYNATAVRNQPYGSQVADPEVCEP